MKIKMKCAEALSHVNELTQLFQNKEIKYPAAALINGNRNRRVLLDEIEDYLEKRNELIEKYGTKEESGNISITPYSDNWKEFAEEMKPFDMTEIEAEITMIKAEIFTGQYTADEILPFDFMLEC